MLPALIGAVGAMLLLLSSQRRQHFYTSAAAAAFEPWIAPLSMDLVLNRMLTCAYMALPIETVVNHEYTAICKYLAEQ